MAEPRTAVNRAVLAVTGGVLLLSGAWSAGMRTAPVERLTARLSSVPGMGWVLPPADGSVLLDRSGLAALRAHGWWTPAVIAVGSLVTALLTWWFLGQLRLRVRSRLRLAASGGVLRTQALEEALTRRAASVDGVARARVRLHTRRRRLRAYVHVWLEPDTTPLAVLDALTAVGTEAEAAVAPHALTTRLRLGHRTHRMPHVR
ncbi:hypothetical protein [Streptomyces qinglanensis]|uniref:Alkaline shock response membrane anchor protein AmaP n=1 Tax=Streptomyces qinglanensis TaxID=943816 RepID=A0A1H9PK80_9ACTN|nr:hypothetical protein [Streptomyces qinglanensis]SER48594.1 hypothetical protein SAMN05421870_10279 [Streptomyces qinglanensis]